MSVNDDTGLVTRRADATRDAVQVAHTATVNTLGKLYWGDTLHEVLIGADYMNNHRDLGDLLRNTASADFNYNAPVYGSYTESFRPNTSIATPIGDLPPEEGKAYELGTKFENDAITATVALFTINKKNVQTSEACGTEICTRVSGEVRSRGLEVGITGQLDEFWSITGSYAYTDTEVLKDPILEGAPLDGVSKHTAAAYLTRDFGHVGVGDLRAGAGARYASRWGVNDGAGVEYYLTSSTVADAFVSYKMKIEDRDLTLQLNLKNVFDERYYVSSSGLGSPAIVIGEPRQLVARAKLDF